MALISCPECSTQVSDKAMSCPSCGCPIGAPQMAAVLPAVTVSKSRGLYIILGILFGAVGFHNFYSGHYVSGAIKFGLFMIAFGLDASTHFYSAFSLIALALFEIWALIEIVAIDTDGAGNKML